jgi:thiol-disulfide isomerase/thioredoxin
MVLSTKQLTSRLKKLNWWQKIIVLLVGLYVLKQLLDLFKITSTLRALADIKREFNFLSGSSETFEASDGASEGSQPSNVLNCTMYYAPWCGHCKTAKPEWEKLEQALSGQIINGTKILITKIDCEKYPKVAEEQGIQGFPTFKFEMKGKYYDYKGGRTFGEWKQYIESIVHADSA